MKNGKSIETTIITTLSYQSLLCMLTIVKHYFLFSMKPTFLIELGFFNLGILYIYLDEVDFHWSDPQQEIIISLMR